MDSTVFSFGSKSITVSFDRNGYSCKSRKGTVSYLRGEHNIYSCKDAALMARLEGL